MKKTIEILKAIEAARAAIKNDAEKEKNLIAELARQTIKRGDDDAAEKAHADYKKALEAYNAEQDENTTQKMIIEILKNNYKLAFLAEYGAIICDIWNKYEGKPHGEKTAEKIRAELREKTGYSIYICNQYGDAHIIARQYYNGDKKMPVNEIEISPQWNGEKQPAIDNNNKILSINAAGLRVNYCGAYVEDPAQQVKKIRTAHKKAAEAYAKFEAAASEYNALTRGAINRINPREGVKKWFV